MGTSAQVDQITALVSSYFTAIRNLVGNKRNLERIVSEKFQSLIFGQDQTVEGLRLRTDLLGRVLNSFVVLFSENLKGSN